MEATNRQFRIGSIIVVLALGIGNVAHGKVPKAAPPPSPPDGGMSEASPPAATATSTSTSTGKETKEKEIYCPPGERCPKPCLTAIASARARADGAHELIEGLNGRLTRLEGRVDELSSNKGSPGNGQPVVISPTFQNDVNTSIAGLRDQLDRLQREGAKQADVDALRRRLNDLDAQWVQLKASFDLHVSNVSHGPGLTEDQVRKIAKEEADKVRGTGGGVVTGRLLFKAIDISIGTHLDFNQGYNRGLNPGVLPGIRPIGIAAADFRFRIANRVHLALGAAGGLAGHDGTAAYAAFRLGVYILTLDPGDEATKGQLFVIFRGTGSTVFDPGFGPNRLRSTDGGGQFGLRYQIPGVFPFSLEVTGGVNGGEMSRQIVTNGVETLRTGDRHVDGTFGAAAVFPF